MILYVLLRNSTEFWILSRCSCEVKVSTHVAGWAVLQTSFAALAVACPTGFEASWLFEMSSDVDCSFDLKIFERKSVGDLRSPMLQCSNHTESHTCCNPTESCDWHSWLAELAWPDREAATLGSSETCEALAGDPATKAKGNPKVVATVRGSLFTEKYLAKEKLGIDAH